MAQEAATVFLKWPYRNGHVVMTPEAQLRIAKERVDRFLATVAPRDYPGQVVTVAFAFGGFVPHGSSDER